MKKTAVVLLAALTAKAFLLRCRRENPNWEKLSAQRWAHRGLHDGDRGIPENSMAAFRRAIDRGFGAELDVHLLSDGNLAVLHDSGLKRMTGQSGEVEDLSAAELKSCRLQGTGETIPLLHEVLSAYEGTGLSLIVELKSHRGNHDALTERTVAELDKFHVPYSIESFDPRCLAWLRRHRGEIVRGQLAQNFRRESSGVERVLGRVLSHLHMNFLAQPDFIAYKFEDRKNLSLFLCRTVFGVRVFHWTICSREDMEQAEREGARVIFEGFLP